MAVFECIGGCRHCVTRTGALVTCDLRELTERIIPEGDVASQSPRYHPLDLAAHDAGESLQAHRIHTSLRSRLSQLVFKL